MNPKLLLDLKRLRKVADELREAPGIIGCMPVDWEYLKELVPRFEGYFPKAGSRQDTCLVCEQKVWVGPAQQEMLAKDNTIPILCCMCGVFLAEASGAECKALSKESGAYFFKSPTEQEPN